MDVEEGKVRSDHGVLFKKVGADIPVLRQEVVSQEEEEEHEKEKRRYGFSAVPLQGLAVSNKFGLTFFVTSDGYGVAHTDELVKASQGLIDFRKIIDIRVENVRLLALSSDELTIAACLDSRIYFYNVPKLLQQEAGEIADKAFPKSVSMLDMENMLKVFTWCPTKHDAYFCLSRGGTLKCGGLSQESRVIAEEVEAADWSPDGDHLSYVTRDKNVHIVKVETLATSSYALPMEALREAKASEVEVDSLKWVRLDSMLISFTHNEADDGQADCTVFLLNSEGLHFLKDMKAKKLLSFTQFFTSIDPTIIPSGSGPYLLASYIQPWELAIVTSRRSTDDHIVILGWTYEDDNAEPCKFELVIDNFIPRIELQESGDDNAIVGLGVDLTTSSVQLPIPSGEANDKLPPGPLLLCMTLEGYLVFFSMARNDPKWLDVEVICTLMPLPEPIKETNMVVEKPAEVELVAESVMMRGPKEVGMPVQPSLTLTTEMKQAVVPQTMPKQPSQSIQQTANMMFGKVTPTMPKGKPVLSSVETKQAQFPSASAMPPIKSTQSPFALTVGTIQVAPSSMIQETKLMQPLFASILEQKQVEGPPVSAGQMTKGQVDVAPMSVGLQTRLKQTSASSGLGKNHVQSSLMPEVVGSRQAYGSSSLGMEADFVKELDKIKIMAKEIENLLSFIDGKCSANRGVQKTGFTKSSLEVIENEIQKLSGNCHQFQMELKEQRQNLSDVLDDTMQVYSWSIYVQSLLDQAADGHYQDLWNSQKLHPEMDAMRRHILKLDQLLKYQIAELEEHIHNLELSHWWKNPNQSVIQPKSAVRSSESFHQMQALYGTINTQMVIAQQLSERLATQIEMLKLSKEEISGLIDLSTSKLQGMTLNGLCRRASGQSNRVRPMSLRDLTDGSPVRAGVNCTLLTPQQPVVDTVHGPGAGLQDSTRRRRDSLDKLWSNVGTAKTTVKRVSPLQHSQRIFSSTNDRVPSATTQARWNKLQATQVGASNVAGSISQTSPVGFTSRNTSAMKKAVEPPMTGKQKVGQEKHAGATSSSTKGLSQNLTEASSGVSKAARSKGFHLKFENVNIDEPKVQLHVQEMQKSTGPIDSVVKLGDTVSGVNMADLPELVGSFQAVTTTGMVSTAFNTQSSLVCGPSHFGTSSPELISHVAISPSSISSCAALSVSSSANTSSLITASSANMPFPSKSLPILSSPSSAPMPIPINVAVQSSLLTTASPTVTITTQISSLNVPPPVNVSAAAASSSLISQLPETASLPVRTTTAEPSLSQLDAGGTVPVSASVMPSLRLPGSAGSSSPLPFESSYGVPSLNDTSLFGTAKGSEPPQTLPPPTNAPMPPLASPTPLLTVIAEEEMEEEVASSSTADITSGGFSNFVLGSSTATAVPAENIVNPFGGSLFGSQSAITTMLVPSGQLFKPASFSLPTQSSPQQSMGSPFGTSFGSGFGAGSSPFGNSAQTGVAGFGQPAQPGLGQQALGSSLGIFGQTRQIGSPFGTPSFSTAGGFASAATGGGFASAATGGGFAGFSSSAGFTGASGGFQSFAGSTGGGGAFGTGFSGFGSGTKPSIFTQMRK